MRKPNTSLKEKHDENIRKLSFNVTRETIGCTGLAKPYPFSIMKGAFVRYYHCPAPRSLNNMKGWHSLQSESHVSLAIRTHGSKSRNKYPRGATDVEQDE